MLTEGEALEIQAQDAAPSRAGAPRGLMTHLDDVKDFCARFSDAHRNGLPTELLEKRLTEVLDTVGDVFQDRVMQICFILDHHGVLRYNELLHTLPKMSTRTLSNKLTLLQDRGLIVRTMFDENPPRVEYRLTARGKALVDLLFPAVVHINWTATQGARR